MREPCTQQLPSTAAYLYCCHAKRTWTTNAVLEEMLELVTRSFDPETARALAGLRIGKRTQARVEKLAEKCGEGKLTPSERAEYEAYVQASTVIGILHAKARRALA